MSKTFQSLLPQHIDFLRAQKLFFVATSPLSEDGHVNLSPKGLDSLRVLDPSRIAYLDLTGSGVETLAHVNENRRITLMACAFEGPPNILRAYGRGEVTLPSDEGWPVAAAGFPSYSAARAIVTIHVNRVTTSCGFGVPLLDFRGERSQLIEWAGRKTPDQLSQYQAEKNRTSIDGLPGLPAAKR